ncbi:MAG: hypothetical protein ACXADY_27045 [Candidatus Hodarchaeales archaeon]|jgi:hypothetical protein
MDWWQVYLITRLDAICELLIPFIIFAGMGTMICTLVVVLEPDHWGKYRNRLLIAPIILLISLLGGAFIPTTKDALLIIGVDAATHNERIEKNVEKTLDYFEKVLDEKLKTLDK